MKKSTFIVIMLLISFGLSSKNSDEIQKKIQQKQEKFSVLTQLNSKLSSLAKFKGSDAILKSAASTQKLDSTLNLVWNEETQLWQKDYKDEYLFDTEMKNTAWVGNEWNLTNNTWDVISKTELGYDNSDWINSMLLYESDEFTQEPKQVSKIMIFYGSEGMQDSISMSSSEDGGVTWVLDMKQINHYSEAKQLIKTDIWTFDEDFDELTLSMNIVNSYTASGQLKTSSINILDEDFEIAWSVTEYGYDGSGKLTSIEYSMISFQTFTMQKSSRMTFQYNVSGDMTVEINSKWNGTSWVDEDKTEFVYNAAGDVSVESFSTWNGTAWMEDRKDEYTYSTTNFSEVAFPQFGFVMDVFSSFLNLFGIQESNDFSFNKVITNVNSFEMKNGNWENTEKTTFYYSGGISTNISEFENSIVNVYPNPASEYVNFGWKGNHEALTLQMFQITGARVLDQTVYSGRPVSISHLENGVYIYKLLNGQQNLKTGKLIKK
jgi:YD repeat-containing protein